MFFLLFFIELTLEIKVKLQNKTSLKNKGVYRIDYKY